MTRLERIVGEIGRMLPEQTRWHQERFERFKDKGPFKLLIQIVLSHQTTIKIEDRAIERLWTRFQTPEQFASARFEDVDNLIKDVNYHPTKARRIIAISQAVLEKWGGSFDFLNILTLEHALGALTSLPGVGRKTASTASMCLTRRSFFVLEVTNL